MSQPPERKRAPRVHIYGAGIAGLTAAHELARRGFDVRVVEPDREYDETGHLEGPPAPVARRSTQQTMTYTHLPDKLAVGGLARSQFIRVEKGASGNFPGDGLLTTSEDCRFFYEYDPDFTPTGQYPIFRHHEWDNRLERFLNRAGLLKGGASGVLYIRIPPSPDGGRAEKRWDNALAMHGYLTRERPWGDHLDAARVVIADEVDARLAKRLASPLRPLEDQEGLQLEMQHFLPGEHGFRFFPSYYRHLFSTMVETPILDAHGEPTGRRVFDNLVPSSFYGIAAQGRRIRFLRRAPATRPVQLLQELSEFASSGYPPSDTLQFTLRIWRYMCTCSERRKAEYERISWWEYLEGYDAKTGSRRYQYSEAFKKDMQFAPRVLAAFDGAWGDARTNGNTLTQLYLNNLLPLPKTDGTLNGPTTPAWFRPWRRYLEEKLKVEFKLGRLTRFELEMDRLVPYWISNWAGDDDTGQRDVPDTSVADPLTDDSVPVDYYIVATDAAAAEQVTRSLEPLGVIQGLRGFTTTIPPNPRGKEPAQPRPEEWVLPGHVPWDRFQTLTGIQFFFPASVRLAEGYLYFLDAPWGLSAINSHQYWATPPNFGQDGFASVLSVDIGNWYVRERGLKSPSTSSRHELAHEVWRQIKSATAHHNAPLPHAGHYGFALPEPSWYHVDRYICFKEHPDTRSERPWKNLAPYLIPILGDWDNRPGPEPWNPLVPTPPGRPRPLLPKGLWQAPHGGYCVHWGQLVFAGTYLKTFTRMTTMESANESARHAVNAILDHYLAHKKPEEPKPRSAPVAGARMVPEYPGGELVGSPDFRMTPIGEYCRIWDPEQHELPELVPLRELDAKLFAAGLPHVWDVLGLEPLAVPLMPGLDSPGGLESLLELLRKVREGLESLVRHG